MAQAKAIFSAAAISARQEKVSRTWSSMISNDDLVLIGAGSEVGVPGGLDQVFQFKAHPDYYWLTGHQRSGGVVCFSKQDGFVEFQRSLSLEEKLWEGGREEAPTGKALSELESYVSQFKSEKQIHLGIKEFEASSRDDFRCDLRAALHQCRRKKDSEELALIRSAAAQAKVGYDHIMKVLASEVSLTERQVQLEYEFHVMSAGADQMPYSTIVGAGANAAVLHALPTAKVIQNGELVLIDAGAEIHDYCVDITRVFNKGNAWAQQQKDLYSLVLQAQKKSFESIRVGVRWGHVHLAAAKSIADSLKALGLLRVDSDLAIESGAIAMFFPHGVGHLMGLKVRDTGHLENKNPQKYAGARIRVDLALEEDQVLTVEPGCYFVEALLENEQMRNQYKNEINWAEVEKWKSIGGVRIEDDVRILNSAESHFENLTESVGKFSF